MFYYYYYILYNLDTILNVTYVTRELNMNNVNINRIKLKMTCNKVRTITATLTSSLSMHRAHRVYRHTKNK
jgi:hypothetical protein